jgi:hypothetical protein
LSAQPKGWNRGYCTSVAAATLLAFRSALAPEDKVRV